MYWRNLFPNRFYLELQRVGKPNEEAYIAAAIDVALALNLPVVATNDVRFIKQNEFAAHEIRVCINQGRVLDDARRPKIILISNICVARKKWQCYLQIFPKP